MCICWLLGLRYYWVAQTVERLSAMWEIQVQSLGWEDPLGKEMVAHSSILAWKIPWMEELGSLWGCKESDTTEWLHFHSFMIIIYIFSTCFLLSIVYKPNLHDLHWNEKGPEQSVLIISLWAKVYSYNIIRVNHQGKDRSFPLLCLFLSDVIKSDK